MTRLKDRLGPVFGLLALLACAVNWDALLGVPR